MYDVDMTNLANGFFVIFTSDISYSQFSNDDSKLPFKLSRFYLACREQAKLFF